MDCCNYMPYRHPQPYYGYYNEPLPQYHAEYYGPQNAYHDYYRNMSPYYNPQHWQGDVFMPQDYVYNPKEARIRKAMREAATRDNRDRSIGCAPMLARPNAKRPPTTHGWTPTPHDELMMSPLPSGMRAGLDSPCYASATAATGPAGGGGQFLASISAPGNGYPAAKLRQESTAAPQNTGYMQPNPLTQLHQQREMWHNYQDEMRPRSSGNPFMMHQDMPSPYAHHQPSPPLSIPSPHMMDQPPRQPPHPLHSLAAVSMPMTPPHSNENVPPDEWAAGNAKILSEDGRFADAKSGEPLAENNVQPQGGLSGFYGGGNEQMQQQQQIDKNDGVRQCKKVIDSSPTCHKSATSKHTMYLPLSCMKFCASPDLFANNLDYQKEYIAKYFQNSAEYEILNFATEDGGSFPYASVINTRKTVLVGDSPQPGHVDYIPIVIDDKNVLDSNNIRY